MSIRSIIKNLLPYCISVSYSRRQKKRFAFEKNNNGIHNIHYDEKSFFNTIVSVEGFGYSGSGAVIDLLREYNEVLVMGGVDAQEGSLAKRGAISEEMDFIRLTGGLLEIEKYIEGNNVFFNDAVIHRLIKLVESSSVFAANERARQFIYNFLHEIIDFEIDGLPKPMYNTYLNDSDNTIFFLRQMPLADYRDLCRRLILSIFNCYEAQGKDVLVADQLFSDLEFDIRRNCQYVPQLKTIVVYRDPRDVFAFAYKRKISWIPYYDVDVFVKWVKGFYRRFDKNSVHYLAVRYEDLICNYDTEVKKIEQYLDIDQHYKPKSCFDPSISCRNVGIWRESDMDSSVFKKIELELYELCS